MTTGLNPLVSFGELSQCTDDIGFCGVRSRDGWMAIEPIEIGDRSFLGPGSILRGGTRLDDDSLLGVMTLSPKRPAAGSSWLGVPALELPRVPDATDPSRTVNPPRRLKLARGVMDLLRLLVPNTIVLVIEAVEIMSLAAVGAHFGLVAAIVAAPFVLIGGALVATAVTVAMKWILIGHYRRSEHPLWCSFVWRDEMMNAAQEQLADERLLRLAMGTPIMSMYLRAMGSKIGRGVWCETTAVTEHDMIDLGDGTAVNRGGCLMTHLFHDRLLRIGPTHARPGRHPRPDSGSPSGHPPRRRHAGVRTLGRAQGRGTPGRHPLARHAGRGAVGHGHLARHRHGRRSAGRAPRRDPRGA